MSRVLVWWAVLALWGTAVARGDLQFAQPQVDQGKVLTGTRLVHSFRFSNSGRVPIAVRSLRSSCGCLTTRLDRRIYLPGESGEIVLEVNTLSQPEGPNGWRVDVEYVEGESIWQQALELRATLETEIEVTPASLTLYTDGSLSGAVSVKDRRPESRLQLTDCCTSSPHLQARVNAAQAGLQTVALTLLPRHPEGRHEATLSVFTNDPTYPELRVPVTIVKRAKQGISCSPEQINLATTATQTAASRVVLVRGSDDTAVEIQSVQADHPALQCRWAAGPGTMATVKVAIDATQVSTPTLSATVTIQVTKPAPQMLTVPVSFTRQ